MPINFLVQIAIAVVMLIVSYVLAPKPKQPKPASVDDLKEPTAEAGRPVPVVFGTMNVKGLNVLWYGDKSINNRTVKSGGKK
jgi:predicted phage tail protein